MNKERKYIVYLIENKKNGKIYIGATSHSIKERLRKHFEAAFRAERKYKESGKKITIILYKAIIKYKKSNFTIKEIASFNSREEMFNGEVELIKQYNSTDHSIGYNMTKGGESSPTIISLNPKLITDVLTEYISGANMKNVAKKYNISYYSVIGITELSFSPDHNIDKALIRKIKQWKATTNKRKRVDEKCVISVITDFVSDISVANLAKKYKMSTSNIYSIVNREILKDVKLSKELENRLNEKKVERNFGKNTVPLTKIEDWQVVDILTKFSTGEYSARMIANDHNISNLGIIYGILNRKHHINVYVDSVILDKVNKELLSMDDKYFVKSKYYENRMLSKKAISKLIVENAISLLSIKDISKKLEIPRNCIDDFLSGKSWNEVEIPEDLIKQFYSNEKFRKLYPNFRPQYL